MDKEQIESKKRNAEISFLIYFVSIVACFLYLILNYQTFFDNFFWNMVVFILCLIMAIISYACWMYFKYDAWCLIPPELSEDYQNCHQLLLKILLSFVIISYVLTIIILPISLLIGFFLPVFLLPYLILVLGSFGLYWLFKKIKPSSESQLTMLTEITYVLKKIECGIISIRFWILITAPLVIVFIFFYILSYFHIIPPLNDQNRFTTIDGFYAVTIWGLFASLYALIQIKKIYLDKNNI